jgi:RNA polymerase sigma factor (sigma-70 family)
MALATNRLRGVLRSLGSTFEPQSDDQLLARFVLTHDETAFATLVRRHGPLVLGVCRRVLQHTQDAEDVFQATFLILARKAESVLKREAIGSWLYRVAYRAAQEARTMRSRRRAREQHVDPLPHPGIAAAEVQDWRPVLDQELSRLPEKYHAPIVLCDLEARPRREVAQQLGIPEGTLSSRLANGRKLLAARLARRGVTVGAGGLAMALSVNVLTAQVPASLVGGTAKAAVLVAAGELAAVSPSILVLMKGALKAMFIAKLKAVVGLLIGAAVTCAVGGVAYQSVGAQNPPPAANTGKPPSELEALRKENELLKLNLQVVLEKVRAQEAELRALKQQARRGSYLNEANYSLNSYKEEAGVLYGKYALQPSRAADQSLETAVKKLREANSDDARRQAAEALDRAVQKLRQELGLKKAADLPK